MVALAVEKKDWETVILVSCQKVLTFGSCFKYDSGLGACFTVEEGTLVVAQNFSSQADTPAWICSHGNSSIGRHCEHFRHLGSRKYQVCVFVFMLSSEDPGPQDPVAVETSECPR